VINFRGIIPVFTPAVSSLIIPLGIQFFLCLLSKNKLLNKLTSKNKLLTRNNLSKRKKIDDSACLFVLVGSLFSKFSLILSDIKFESCYGSIAKMWLCNKKFFYEYKKFGIANVVTSAV
jgi:hypothetical protein